jgi:hypothetical protein
MLEIWNFKSKFPLLIHKGGGADSFARINLPRTTKGDTQREASNI